MQEENDLNMREEENMNTNSNMSNGIVSPLTLSNATGGSNVENCDSVESILESTPDGLDVDTIMHDAAVLGHLNIVKLCVEKGAKNFNFGLDAASNMDVVKYMVEKQGNDIHGLESPIYHSIKNGRMEFANQMIQYAEDKRVKLNWNHIIRDLIYRKDIRGVEFCLEKGGSDVDQTTLVQIEKMRKEIREEEAYSNEISTRKSEARKRDIAKECISAAKIGDLERVRLLLESESLKVGDIEDIMQSAASGGHLDIIRLCIKEGAKDFEFIMRSASNIEVVKFLVEQQGEPVNLELPLYHSIAENRSDFTEQIIRYAKDNGVILDWNQIVDAPIYLEDMEGIEFCLREGGSSINQSTHTRIEELRERIRDEERIRQSEAREKDLMSECCRAAEGGDIGTIQSILQSPLSVEHMNKIMLSAAKGGHPNIMKLCAEMGANNFELCMLDAPNMEVVKFIVERKGGEIRNLEYPLSDSIAKNRREFTEQMIQYAEDNKVKLKWNCIISKSISCRNVEGVEFCLKKAGNNINRVILDDILDMRMEIIRERN